MCQRIAPPPCEYMWPPLSSADHKTKTHESGKGILGRRGLGGCGRGPREGGGRYVSRLHYVCVWN